MGNPRTLPEVAMPASLCLQHSRQECKSPGETMILKGEETELGRLIYVFKFSNQTQLSFGREHKQGGRDQLEVHFQRLTLIDGKYQFSFPQWK